MMGLVPDERGLQLLELLQAAPASRRDGMPLYLQVANALEQAIALGRLPSDESLPSERELTQAFRVSRPTLRQALSQLAQQGVLYTRKGVGTFAAPPALSRRFSMASVYDDLLERGLNPRTVVLAMRTMPADGQLAAALRIAEGTPIVSLERLRLAGDRPVAVMHNDLDLKGGLPPTKTDLEEHGLYELLRRRYGIQIAMGRQRLTSRLATRSERAALNLANPDAVLVSNRLSFDTEGRGYERAEVVLGSNEFVEMRLEF
jgi:DNA-binding GntR family transcriptional regulator